jgi:hypothetical protein
LEYGHGLAIGVYLSPTVALSRLGFGSVVCEMAHPSSRHLLLSAISSLVH